MHEMHYRYHRTAQTLGLTQPAITRRLQNFEEALGVELLDRNTRPLKATATGRVVYEQCRVIQREIDVLRELVADDTPPVGTLHCSDHMKSVCSVACQLRHQPVLPLEIRIHRFAGVIRALVRTPVTIDAR